jgi:hypothetical protein
VKKSALDVLTVHSEEPQATKESPHFQPFEMRGFFAALSMTGATNFFTRSNLRNTYTLAQVFEARRASDIARLG